MNLADLKAPFVPSKISWRIGSTNGDKTKGMALAFIDARDVQDRLEEVCGPNWQNRFVPMHDKKTVCEIGIRIPRPVGNEDFTNASAHEWIWRSDGAGDSDVEAEKGALSDSFKRAAVKWGVGRYLYDLDSPWVAIEAAGRSFKIAPHEYKRLEALLSGTSKPTQREAIHGPSTMKPETSTVTPQVWVEIAIARVKGFTQETDLEAFEAKFFQKIASLSSSVPDLHTKLVDAIKDAHIRLGG